MIYILGDEILEVNGESFENLTRHEAVAAIKKHKKGAACLRVLVVRQKTTKSQQRFTARFAFIHNYACNCTLFKKTTLMLHTIISYHIISYLICPTALQQSYIYSNAI